MKAIPSERSGWFGWFGWLLVWSAMSCRALSGSPAAPNIVLILSDDQGYGDFSCHGNPVLKTPNLDRLHDEGRRFTDFQVSPTCAPTRCALMTGRHEFKSGVTHTILERERMSLHAVTLAEVLKSAGYSTGIFGKWHLGDEPQRCPSKRGFDEMFIHGGGGIGQTFPGSCGDAPGNTYFDPAILHNGKFEKTKGYCTDVFFAEAQQWISRQAKARKRFFAYVTPNVPHSPLQVPEAYEQLYAGRVPKNPARFFGMIANLDENVGKLLSRLKELGIERETLVIYMNDNGGTAGVSVFNAGMRGAKASPWIGGTRAASFWRWPGTFATGDIKALAAHLDILPTLMEIAGTQATPKLQQQIEGRSLLPLLKNPQAPWPDRTLLTHVGRWPQGKTAESKYARCSIRNSRWQLVNDTAGPEPYWQLFDLIADPGERNDVRADHLELSKELERTYDQWWTSVLPCLENESVVGPKENPFKELYWKQFGRPAGD